jgi:Ca2+-binding RTX toxin-like protein
VTEAPSSGLDRIVSSISLSLNVAALVNVENLTLSGAAALDGIGNGAANTIVGNNGDNSLSGLGGSDQLLGQGGIDSLSGGDGNDLLDGGAAADMISTGTGVDSVRFSSALGADNIDQVLDFSATFDTFQLDDAIFTGLAAGVLPAAAFVIGAVAAGADDRIVYDSASGALYFDADGVGGAAQTQFALTGAGLALTSADFVVV